MKARTDSMIKAIRALEMDIERFQVSQSLRTAITRNGGYSEQEWMKDAKARLHTLRENFKREVL